jgi:hypothetical protein
LPRRFGAKAIGTWRSAVEVEIASQGETEDDALANLEEALELRLEPPRATRPPAIAFD